MTDFTDFMDLAARCAVEVLKDAKEVDFPFVIIVDTEDRLYIRVLGMDIQFFKRAIQEMLVRVNAKFYAFVSEAWYVLIEKEGMSALKLPIRENPDRKEVVQIVGYSKNSQKLVICIPFERGPNRTIVLKKTTRASRTSDFKDNLLGNLFSAR